MIITSLENLIAMWNKDSNIDHTEPGLETLKIPNLHAKYLAQVTANSLALKKLNLEYLQMRKLKNDYYLGRLTQEELKTYNFTPFQFILKSDINLYLDADQDLMKISAKKIPYEEARDFCVAVVKELNSRTYQLRSYIDYLKFSSGQ
jgi:hypothetical protein